MKSLLFLKPGSASSPSDSNRSGEVVKSRSETTQSAPPVDSSVAMDLNRIFQAYAGPAFTIRFWDGAVWDSSIDESRFEIILKSEQAWKTLTSMPDEISLGRQYVEGGIEVGGDLYLALRAVPSLERAIRTSLPTTIVLLREWAEGFISSAGRLCRFGAKHNKSRDAAAISQHYDKPSSFYKLFLGPSMVYSCAYFQRMTNDLTQAQTDKMELICRKLNLESSERFLDIGCGWGSLLLHAVRKYGVYGHGVSLSKEQVAYAQDRIAEEKRGSRCCAMLMDYRDLLRDHRPFNKLASVGMCEHVGQRQIDGYFRNAYDLLVPGGLFLNHGITRSAKAKRGGPSFVDRYVFPDGELLTLTEMIRSAEEAGFEVRDVEDLREHYEETLHRWVDSLTRHEQEAISLTDRETYRVWKLYMAGSAEAFRRGEIAIHQLLLSKSSGGKSNATRTRSDWYTCPWDKLDSEGLAG